MNSSDSKRFPNSFGLLFIALFLVLGIVSVACASAQHAVIPDAKACKVPTATQVEWLAQEWREFLPFVRVCPVRDAHSNPVVLIVSVWAELYYLDKPQGTVTVSMPKPLLFLPEGKLVGLLPMNYPDDPPHELVPIFTSWQHGFPRRINLSVKSPSASGDRMLPSLIWSRTAGKYEYFWKKGNKMLTMGQTAKYPLCMSTSIGGWPGAKSKGDKTVWDPWGNDKIFEDVRFWTPK